MNNELEQKAHEYVKNMIHSPSYKAAFKAGHTSRDAEVNELTNQIKKMQERIGELENRIIEVSDLNIKITAALAKQR